MIPLKEEPNVSSTLCFSDEDAEQLLSCQNTLAHAGNVLITAARHEKTCWSNTRGPCSRKSINPPAAPLRLGVCRNQRRVVGWAE